MPIISEIVVPDMHKFIQGESTIVVVVLVNVHEEHAAQTQNIEIAYDN